MCFQLFYYFKSKWDEKMQNDTVYLHTEPSEEIQYAVFLAQRH
jgi:hypothetical protein